MTVTVERMQLAGVKEVQVSSGCLLCHSEAPCIWVDTACSDA
jgi:hypothetical protein